MQFLIFPNRIIEKFTIIYTFFTMYKSYSCPYYRRINIYEYFQPYLAIVVYSLWKK